MIYIIFMDVSIIGPKGDTAVLLPKAMHVLNVYVKRVGPPAKRQPPAASVLLKTTKRAHMRKSTYIPTCNCIT